MSIILRTNKGSALTYDEMDRNQSQFYYSSSLHDSNSKLRLHFTGSDSLDLPGVDYGPTRYHEIQFPSVDIEIPDAIAAPPITAIQFNKDGTFGADPLFVFNEIGNLLGIGTNAPLTRIDVHGDSLNQAALSLRGYAAGTGNEKQAKINFYESSTFIGRIGRTDGNNGNLYITNNYTPDPKIADYGKVHISIGNSGADNNEVAGTFTRNTGISKFGVGTTNPNRAGTFVGGNGIGISSTSANTNQSYIETIPSTIYNQLVDGKRKLVPHDSDPAGLLISSPNTLNGGNVVVALNTDGFEYEGFNIIKSSNGSYANSEVIASFQASGKVGINTNFPSDVGLTVAGIISGSGNAYFDGNVDGGGTLNISGNSTLGGTLEVAGATALNGGLTMDTDKFTVADGTGNTYVDGTLTVKGATALNGGLTMDTDKFTVADGTGNTAIAGTLNVTGNITGNKLIKTGGTSTQVLMADGSVKNTGTAAGDVITNQGSTLSPTYGYQKLSTGMIVQGGRINGSSTSTLVTFPTAFPTNCIAVTVSTERSSGGSNGFNHVYNVTSASFRAILDSPFDGYYIAIGY